MERQKGFAPIIILVIIIAVVVGAVFLLKPKNVSETANNLETPSNQTPTTSDDAPPMGIKNIGVSFDAFVFTSEQLQFDRMFMPYGFVIPGNSTTSGKNKANPQPTFIVPLGTPVTSLVDGVVVDIPTLWSGDMSIMVAQSKDSSWIFETEHVRNPKVKIGDRVKAGQVIAEVGAFGGYEVPGYGEVEIGILHGGNPPEHVCPFEYIDPSIKDEVLGNIKSLYSRWEEYKGNTSLYNENEPVPGCITLDAIPG